MKEFIINKNDSGQRIDKFIRKAAPNLPDSMLFKGLRLKKIKINGKRAHAEDRISEGDVVTLYLNDEFFENKKIVYYRAAHSELNIIYEDNNIILVDKEPGVSVHEDKYSGENTLIDYIKAYLYKKGEWSPKNENSFVPALCNRIDRNTGGIVIAAKNAESLRMINEKIKNREIRKFYICIVHGKPEPSSGTLTGYIFKDTTKNRVYVNKKSEPGAKTAIMKYKTLAEKQGLALVECELITGRTHQIRAQMADLGNPLLGDGKYGLNRDNKKYNETRQALYSFRLVFDFKTPSGILSYLNKRTFTVKNIGFREKYFPNTDNNRRDSQSR